MEESWDAENFEPKLATLTPVSVRWEGEDEEEDVKESWEDEEEEKKDEEKRETAPAPAKTKKKLMDKIAEKEQRAREEAERRAAELEELLTPEQRLAEKLRRQKLQEEDDLRLAMETFGISDTNTGKLDSFHPTNKEEFDEFAELLSKKINMYRNKDEFPGFVEDLFRNISAQMSSVDIKRIKTTIDNLYIEKQKTEKNDKTKKATKGKGKAKLRVEGDNAHLNQYDTYGNYEPDYDDFM